MAPGAVETLTIQVNVNSGATLTSPIINQACVSTDTIDTNSLDDCVITSYSIHYTKLYEIYIKTIS